MTLKLFLITLKIIFNVKWKRIVWWNNYIRWTNHINRYIFKRTIYENGKMLFWMQLYRLRTGTAGAGLQTCACALLLKTAL